MQRHLTLATRREYALRDAQTTATSVTGQPQWTAASMPEWRHTLVLTGRLDYCSVAELEDEIDNLREEGVGALTLDLRQLDGIDAPAVQVIAAQGALFKEGGRGFTVIPGIGQGLTDDPSLQSLLGESPGERMVPRFSRARVQDALRERCTTMIHYLAPASQAQEG
jgi:ABC-type transporter Mla MlaB component